jgi:hypothetical protein
MRKGETVARTIEVRNRNGDPVEFEGHQRTFEFEILMHSELGTSSFYAERQECVALFFSDDAIRKFLSGETKSAVEPFSVDGVVRHFHFPPQPKMSAEKAIMFVGWEPAKKGKERP